MTPLDLVDISLGVEGLQYLDSELQAGFTFSRLFRERGDLREGEVITRLPPGTSLDEALRFKEGGRLPPLPPIGGYRFDGYRVEKVPSTRPDLARIVGSYLGAGGRACLLEDALESREQAHALGLKARVASHGAEVYHLLTEAVPVPEIEKFLAGSEALFQFLGFLLKVPQGLQLPDDRGEFAQEALEELVGGVEVVFCGAYDGEGYVIWRPRP